MPSSPTPAEFARKRLESRGDGRRGSQEHFIDLCRMLGVPTPNEANPKRTLTNLYNARPSWLRLAHERLDRAVHEAYGWPFPLGGEVILERLLALNLHATG